MGGRGASLATVEISRLSDGQGIGKQSNLYRPIRGYPLFHSRYIACGASAEPPCSFMPRAEFGFVPALLVLPGGKA